MTSYNHIADNCYEEEEIDVFEREEETLLFFAGLLRRDEGERACFMDHLEKSLKLWISRPDDLKAQKLLTVHLPTVLRLSLNAPFADVRSRMEKILSELKVNYITENRVVERRSTLLEWQRKEYRCAGCVRSILVCERAKEIHSPEHSKTPRICDGYPLK